MRLTAQIGEFVASTRFGHLPPEVLPIVRTGFTDCAGVMIAGAREAATRIALAHTRMARTGARGILLGELAGDAPQIALVYGTAAHALDYDDTAFGSHPSAVLVPAVLAEAAETGATGGQMALAYIAGYEVWAELIWRDKDQHHRKGWHPSATFGAVAAAAASAVLRGLNAEQARHAIGIAASFAGGTVANFGSLTKPYHIGRAAQSGLDAARLAQHGLTAQPDAIEHDLGFLRAISPKGDVDTETPATLGTRWRILESGVNVKLFPMCYATHRIINGMVDLVREHALVPEAIGAVEVEIGEAAAAMLRNHRPNTTHEAKFSAEFAMAVAAVAGRCTAADLEEDFIARPQVQDFFEKVRVTQLTEKKADEPAHSPFDRVTVTLTDGRMLQSPKIEYPLGHFQRPAPREALWEKFADCTAGVLDPVEARHLFDKLQRIETLASAGDLVPPRVMQGTG